MAACPRLRNRQNFITRLGIRPLDMLVSGSQVGYPLRQGNGGGDRESRKLGLWYDQLLAESLGKQQLGATPLTVVNTRDLHSRAQQHQEGRRDKMITNLIVDRWRRDPLFVGRSDLDQDGLNAVADRTLPDLMQAAIAGTNQAYREDGRPTANLHLPALDEASLGQVMQMLMLATVIEGRLMGINPYGQPGVETYKRHMKSHLNLA